MEKMNPRCSERATVEHNKEENEQREREEAREIDVEVEVERVVEKHRNLQAFGIGMVNGGRKDHGKGWEMTRDGGTPPT